MQLFDAEKVRLWENPSCTSVNKLPARGAGLFPFATAAAAEKSSREVFDCPAVMNLNGKWSFRYYTRPEEVRPGDYAAAASGKWESITVPANWTCEGYDRPHYTNWQMPWPEQPPFVPDDNPTGVYRRTFKLTEAQSARRTVLHFGGVESCFFVYVNGKAAGMAKDSRTAAEFDISAFVNSGENSLAVIVLRWSDGSFVEDQDHWWMAGIYRDVYLYFTGKNYIEDVFAAAELASNLRDGELTLTCTMGCAGATPEGFKFAAALFTSDGKKVPDAEIELAVPAKAGQAIIRGMLTVRNPLKWSAETPNLYKLVVVLLDAKGKTVEATACRVGFRRVELEDGCVTINGQPVKFFGVNRHDFDPVSGKCVSYESMVRDVALMKQLNINAVRTSHYPNDPRFYDLCDEYGLYMISEANIECHAYTRTISNDPKFAPAFLDRVSRMVLNFKNHPCIFQWSLGNESGYGASHSMCAGWVRKFDPGRLVHYEGYMHRCNLDGKNDQWGVGMHGVHGLDVSDTVCPMYPYFDGVEKWLREVAPLDVRPMIMCEYSHAMGNSNGGLKHYFELFRREKRLQGGFIWDWVDQGLLKKDASGREYWGYGGDFGDFPNDVNFCCNGMINPDRTPHPMTQEFKYLAQEFAVTASDAKAGKFRIHNRNYFRTLGHLRLSYVIEIDGRRAAAGRIAMPRVAPQSSACFKVKYPKLSIKPGQEVFIRFTANTRSAAPGLPAGFEIGSESLKLAFPANSAWRKLRSKGRIEADGNVFSAAGTVLKLDAKSKLPVSWRCDGVELLSAPVAPQFMRGITDNDGIKGTLEKEKWRTAHRWLFEQGLDELKPSGISGRIVSQSSRQVVAATSMRFTAKNGGVITADCRSVFDRDGKLVMRWRFGVAKSLADLPRLGVCIPLAKGFENLVFFGRGPEETYRDRDAGGHIGLFEQSVNSQYYAYVMPQECGNHTGVRYGEVGNGKTALMFGGSELNISALHYTPDDFIAAQHINELKPRKETFLNIDLAQRGLGSRSCGEDTLEQYRIGSGVHRFSFTLQPRRSGESLGRWGRTALSMK